jgi:hypothetical protein
VQIHQDGHNELLKLEEPIPETKKVQDFLSNIIDPKLQVRKDIVIATPQYLQDAEDCQQYLSTLVSNSLAQAKNNRNARSMAHGQDHDEDNEDNCDKVQLPKKKKKKKKLEKVNVKHPLTAMSYSNAELYSLVDPERKELMALCDFKKSGTKKKEKGILQSSSVTSSKIERKDKPKNQLPEPGTGD